MWIRIPQLPEKRFSGRCWFCFKATNLEEAINLANYSDYALTGGVFFAKPRKHRKVKREFKVGNLYINRNITGALVGRQPFGGVSHVWGGCEGGGTGLSAPIHERTKPSAKTLYEGFCSREWPSVIIEQR